MQTYDSLKCNFAFDLKRMGWQSPRTASHWLIDRWMGCLVRFAEIESDKFQTMGEMKFFIKFISKVF